MAIVKEIQNQQDHGYLPKKNLVFLPARSLLTAEEVTVAYGNKTAVRNVNLRFPDQAITALIGPSGCGKSTFLRCFNRMNDSIDNCRITGKIHFQHTEIHSPEVNIFELRKQVGMVFQKPNPFAKSIYKNVAYGPFRHGIKQKKVLDEIVETSLRKAALWDEVKDKLHTSAVRLSGGQQQRLCIARALAIQPRVLLFDEPASALDPISTSKIEALMNDLKKDYTVIVVTHNMQQAARISDYTAFFYMGELIEYGATDDIFARPEDERTAGYIAGNFG